MAKITVLVVDDSALVRKLLSEILNSDPDIEVVGTAIDPYQAREKIKKLNPDVLTLDVEMPRMDGVSFLRNLMRLRPMPVVMVSTLTHAGAQVTLDALELGAVDFVAKPQVDLSNSLADYADELIEKVKAAAEVDAYKLAPSLDGSASNNVPNKHTADVVLPKKTTNLASNYSQKLVAIGASTGGTEALKKVLVNLPADTPPVVVVQHIPASFSEAFTQRLNTLCEMEVCEAQQGLEILPGHVYIGAGDKHVLVRRQDDKLFCEINDGPEVCRHKPSVDVLFRSVAQSVGSNAVGVMMTGMGDDGARGMLEMKEAGAFNFVQDEQSCVVWGMPRQAINVGAAEIQVPLDKIADKILESI